MNQVPRTEEASRILRASLAWRDAREQWLATRSRTHLDVLRQAERRLDRAVRNVPRAVLEGL